MATICEKEFQISVAQPGLLDYWTFDIEDFPPVTFNSEINTALNRLQHNLDQAVDSNPAGILNAAMWINGVSSGNVASVSTLPNTELVLTTGLTWTTWIRFNSMGNLSSVYFFEAIFLNAADVQVFSFSFQIRSVTPAPDFAICEKNGTTFFSPVRTFGISTWYFIQIQFDPNTLKFGMQVGDSTFGLGGMEESTAVADDLSTIAKGSITLRCNRDVSGASSSPDYFQDESGLWLRLLTNAEVISLFGGGTTPPSYPNIPL